ncbi:MAG: lipopolysaccharide biosynthesis protein RfbH [Elusimicrobiaceae bacterium]|nr:lipopolysaccharide biosynthesis protein RfbH [Elusimicrobiaceae bacterium]
MEKQLRETVKQAARNYYKEIYGKKRELNYIPSSGKLLDEEDLMSMIEASLDMWLTAGRFNDQFEKDLSRFLNVRFALSTNSGSSANLLAISALTSPKLGENRLKKGDEVITVAAGFPTTVNPIVQQGLVPVFVDCEVGTYNINVAQIEKAISPKTKAIFLAHTLGNMFDVTQLLSICQKHHLWLVEDSCDALGAEWNGKKAGTIGHIGTYSFYPAHHLTMGEGGAVVTNDPQLYRILLSFRDWGRDCWCKPGVDNTCKNRFNMQLGNLPFGYDHKYTYSHIGYNLKITDWQAALGVSQLKKLPQFLEKRTQNAAYLTKHLSDLQDYLILPKIEKGVTASWFGYLISVKENAPFTKQQLVNYLEEHGIGTRQLFAGNLLRQPAFVDNDIALRIGDSPILNSRDLTEREYARLPQTDFIMNHTFWVGIFPALGEEELSRTVQTIRQFVDKNAKKSS